MAIYPADQAERDKARPRSQNVPRANGHARDKSYDAKPDNRQGKWDRDRNRDRLFDVAVALAECARCGETDAGYEALGPTCPNGHRWRRRTAIYERALRANLAEEAKQCPKNP